MDVAAFKARLEQARAFEHVVGGVTFRLRLPTEHAWRLALEANRDAHGKLLDARAMRVVLDQAVVGWERASQSLLDPEAGEAPLPFSPEARALLLEERQDLADQLAVALGIKIAERRAAREAARKN